MDNQKVFDFLKFRGSYGKVGNDQIPTNSFINSVVLNKAYAFGGYSSPATNGAQINQIIDPNIAWEVTEEYDVAVEFSLLQAKLTGEVNFYNKKTKNSLINVPITATAGDADQLVITNVASIQNKGLEVSLNWKDKINDNLSYHIGGNVTLNQNQVLALNGGQAIFGGGIGASQGFVTSTDNGHPVGSFYVLKQIGVFNSDGDATAYVGPDGVTPIQTSAKAGDFKYLDKNNDGKIDDNDKVYAGSYQPVAYYGVNLGMEYKRWDFSLGIYGNAGNKVYNGKKAVRILGTDNIEKDLVYSRWTSSNHSQSQPRANTGNQLASNYFVESGSFVRINNLTVGYVFSPTLLAKIRISRLRVYATSQNLFTYKKYSGFTAELPGDPLNSGIELTSYPTTRTIALGLNVTF